MKTTVITRPSIEPDSTLEDSMVDRDFAERSSVHIDCDECEMQFTTACQDCVVTHLLRDLAGPLEVDPEQAEAMELLSEAGLVSPLRLVPRTGERDAAAG